jgi:hypothetical protein
MIRMNAMMPMPKADDASLLGAPAGYTDIENARAMVEALRAAGQRSTSEMLQELRRTFPNSPLAVRIRALEALRKL